MTDINRRVAILAAVADHTRLRIVDLLTVGDLSVSEIEQALGIRSNLVSHHLGVLERAGIVYRTRSEFDRRRTYIGLHAGVFETVAPTPLPTPERVLFVCTANSARSQLAEAIWRSSTRIPTLSAGTKPSAGVNPLAVAAAARHRLRLDADAPTRAFDDTARATDLVVSVCDNAHESLGGRDDLHWSIPDPAPSGTAEAFDRAFGLIHRRVGSLLARLGQPVTV